MFLHCCNIYLHIYIALLSETTKLTLFFYTPIFQASEQGRACLPLSPWLLLLPLLTSIVANYVRNNGWKYDVSSSDFPFCCCRDHDSLLHLAPSALSRLTNWTAIINSAVGVVAPFSQLLTLYAKPKKKGKKITLMSQ